MKKLVRPVVGGLAAAILALALAGCATMISGGEQRMDILSDPPEAAVKVYDLSGNLVASARTPATVALKKGRGYFQGASYVVVVEKPGYQDDGVIIQSSLNGGLYIAGNLFNGGLIGWLLVDPMTGAMWTLSPERVRLGLLKEADYPDEGTVMVMLRAETPQ